MKQTLNVAMVGYAFMGRAHSNAWRQVGRYFELPYEINQQVIIGRNQSACRAAAAQLGWQHSAASLREALTNYDIDVVDIATPNKSHLPLAMEAIAAGKHVLCEKPLAMNTDECASMYAAAEQVGVRVGVWHNYRRAPALSMAQRIVSEGRIGEVRHVRAVYLQDWLSDPQAPATWRMQASICGSGAHGDLNAHLIDATRFVTGLEFTAVSSLAHTFTTERRTADGGTMAVDVDDTLLSMARLSNGAVASFEATRVAAGRKNYQVLEINGSRGSVVWNFERMNELQYFSFDDAADTQGFRTIMCMDDSHPYAANFWPDGHIIGYEHTFISTVADYLTALDNNTAFSPNFADGLANQRVLDAALASSRSGQWVTIPSMEQEVSA